MLNQTGYICNVLARFGMSECKLASTPLAVRAQLTYSQSPTTPEDHAAYAQSSNGIVYLEGIGFVLYITQTHPDIQHPVSILAQFGVNPGKAHIKAFKRLLRYLKGTAEFVLTLGSKYTGTDLIRWTDSGLKIWIPGGQSVATYSMSLVVQSRGRPSGNPPLLFPLQRRNTWRHQMRPRRQSGFEYFSKTWDSLKLVLPLCMPTT
jgi:hypothetical protein